MAGKLAEPKTYQVEGFQLTEFEYRGLRRALSQVQPQTHASESALMKLEKALRTAKPVKVEVPSV